MKRAHRWHVVLFALLGAVVIILGAFLYSFWMENKELAKLLEGPRVTFERMGDESGFLTYDAQPSYEGFLEKREELISEKAGFIEADLDKMTITLYEEGVASTTVPIVSKGREGSWWETPSGVYRALTREKNHFSSIGHVWMPWSIQFYGNFFIHGWPYYESGEPVPVSYSGGCIRLDTEDAEKVFEFSSRGMPILILDQESKPIFREAITSNGKDVSPPIITADAALIADLDSGEVFLNKRGGEALPIASLAKLMTATVAGELIYLERSVRISQNMLRDEVQSYPLETGKWYRAFDLLYPLLTQSSNGAARALAGFFGEEYFVYQMNKKAETLTMDSTKFVDPAGVEGANESSLFDLAKLAKYIVDKRQFVFDITRGDTFRAFGEPNISIQENYNEFHEDENLLGMKNGESSTAGQTLLGVWHMATPENRERNIFISILGSENRFADTQALKNWLKDSFLLQ